MYLKSTRILSAVAVLGLRRLPRGIRRRSGHACALALLSLLLAGACKTASDAPESASRYPALDLSFRPNIVWLVAEDLSPLLPSFGDSTVRTPHLDRLAREGVRYTNVYSVSGVCAPSRYAIATGRYPSHDGADHMRTQAGRAAMEAIGLIPYEVVPPPEVRMMSEILRRHGYYATNNAKHDYQFAPPVTAWDESSLSASWRTRPPGRPFFSVFNFDITHESQVWNQRPLLHHLRYRELFTAEPDPRYFERGVFGPIGSFPNHVPDDLDVPIPPYLPDTEAVRRDVRRVYSNIVELDQQVGIILDQLELDGLLDSTIVVFYTDHGGPLPRQKRLLYDSGLHVPMIVRFPRRQHAGTIDDQLISFVDLAPTMFSLAGIEPPGYLDGQAFLGRFRVANKRSYVYAASDRLDNYYDMIRAVRDDRFEYLRNFRPDQGYYLPLAYREQMATMQELLRLRDEGALDAYQSQWFRPSKPEEELFDAGNDPYELHDLAADPDYAERLRELRNELDRWMAAIDDKGFIPEGELIERFWPDWDQPITAAPEARRDGVRIVLSSATEAASIGYRLLADGDSAVGPWAVYTEPVALPAGRRLVCIAHRLGYRPSAIVEFE
jgi:arylsulfatase A-like enzyme